MSKRWLMERRKDPYHRKAKAEKYRSRASYKLFQIQDRFTLIRPGDRVLDLGAAPGGWSQVAVELVGENGFVLGVDLDAIQPMDGAVFLRGDITKPGVQEKMVDGLQDATGQGTFSVIISDMSPNISGNYSMDQAKSVFLCLEALGIAERMLKVGGNMAMKVFEGEDLPELMDDMASRFYSVKRFSPKASRASSSELYVVAKNFRGGRDG